MATPRLKPSDQQQAKDLHKNELHDLTKTIPDIIDKADNRSNKTILDALRRAGGILKSNWNWKLSDRGGWSGRAA